MPLNHWSPSCMTSPKFTNPVPLFKGGNVGVWRISVLQSPGCHSQGMWADKRRNTGGGLIRRCVWCGRFNHRFALLWLLCLEGVLYVSATFNEQISMSPLEKIRLFASKRQDLYAHDFFLMWPISVHEMTKMFRIHNVSLDNPSCRRIMSIWYPFRSEVGIGFWDRFFEMFFVIRTRWFRFDGESQSWSRPSQFPHQSTTLGKIPGGLVAISGYQGKQA